MPLRVEVEDVEGVTILFPDSYSKASFPPILSLDLDLSISFDQSSSFDRNFSVSFCVKGDLRGKPVERSVRGIEEFEDCTLRLFSAIPSVETKVETEGKTEEFQRFLSESTAATLCLIGDLLERKFLSSSSSSTSNRSP